ncbi:MAG TPA: EamA family transporter [Vicinamibacteria bacterium]
MWLLPLSLVLLSAGLHASWNLIVKSEDDKLFSGWLTVVTPAVLLAPALFVTGLPSRDVWPLLAGSAVIHTFYMIALVQAYTHGDLSMVYPVARGLAPLFVAVGAPVILGERLSLPAILGVLLVGGGIAWLGLSARRAAASRAALGWAVATAALICSYSIVDKAGVTRSNPLAYIIVLMGLNGACMTPFVLWRRDPRRLADLWRRRWRISVVGGLLSVTAYLLVLMAMRLTQVTYIAALREVSVILASLLGWRVLKEAYGTRRILASVVVAFGLILLVLAMRG